MEERITSHADPDRISVELSSRRTGMSFQRTRMSADRTLMSVIRTSLSLIGFGFTIFQFFHKLKESGILEGATTALAAYVNGGGLGQIIVTGFELQA